MKKIDWKLYTFLFAVVTVFFNTVILVTIKYNDLHHLHKDVIQLQQKVENIDETVDRLAIKVGKMEGKLEIKE